MASEQLNDSVLRGLADVLGATNSGLSNSEIEALFAEANIEDSRPKAPDGQYVVMSKRDRLFEAWRRRQARDHSPNAVLACIEKAMQPVRYAGNESAFEERQIDLNQRLLHVGLRIDDSGRIATATKATTASEARRLTRRLRAKLEERGTHPKVLAACADEIRNENYFHFVLEATKSLAGEIRRLADGVDADGAYLVDLAFNRKNGRLPMIAWNKVETRTEQSEHDGLTNLCRGIVGAFRNPTGHEPKISWPVSEQEALDVSSTISLLHRRLEGATRVPDSLRS